MASSLSTHYQVTESLLKEHRQMEVLLEQLGTALELLKAQPLSSLPQLRSVMETIEQEINIHFACEEQALFPAVAPYHSMVLMEVEHEELIALRDRLLELMRQEPQPQRQEEIQALGPQFISEMLDHIGREDAGIFPTCEQSLNDTEKAAVIEKMNRIRAEAAHTQTASITRETKSFTVLQPDLETAAARSLFSERLFEENGAEIKHLVIQAGQSLPAHWSPKAITLICLKGQGSFSAESTESNQQTPLQAGTTIVMTPQLRHAIQAESDCHLLLLYN